MITVATIVANGKTMYRMATPPGVLLTIKANLCE
jgi:hypothetical protein